MTEVFLNTVFSIIFANKLYFQSFSRGIFQFPLVFRALALKRIFGTAEAEAGCLQVRYSYSTVASGH